MGGIHRVGPTLPQSTAEIISAAAGRPPLSEQRPAPPEILASRGPSAKPTPQPQEQVGRPRLGRHRERRVPNEPALANRLGSGTQSASD